jgi:dolichyl-phosphate-mannose-protein mannosyltransferase
MRTRKFPVGKDESILLAGYLFNYLPFFLIDRPMYLYHYFTALLFLVLLLPKVTPRIIDCLSLVTNDRLFARVFVVFATILLFVNAILLFPATYGW